MGGGIIQFYRSRKRVLFLVGTGLWEEKGVSSGGIFGNIQLKLNGDLHKYIKHSEERSKMMSLLFQIHHVENGIYHLLKLLSHL